MLAQQAPLPRAACQGSRRSVRGPPRTPPVPETPARSDAAAPEPAVRAASAPKVPLPRVARPVAAVPEPPARSRRARTASKARLPASRPSGGRRPEASADVVEPLGPNPGPAPGAKRLHGTRRARRPSRHRRDHAIRQRPRPRRRASPTARCGHPLGRPPPRPSRRRAAPSRPEGPTAGGSTRPLPRRPRRASPRTVIAPGAPRCLSPAASACRQVTPGSGGRARNRFPTTPPAVLTACRLRAYDTDKSVEFSGRA